MPTSSLLWSVGSLALSSMILPAAASGYQLVETWKGEDFLTAFDFYTGADPTNGFVTYANQSYAESKGLVKVNSNGSFYMGVDHTTKLSTNGPGRESVRIGSNKYYDEGLFIIDLEHMPGSVCGTWPAFWSTGKDWPTDGEIDIIEGVNKNEANEIVLHTSGTCQVSSQKMTGTLSSTECGEDSGTTGCVVEGTQGSSGTPFNENGGGVYAMQWTDEFLKFWFFPRGSIPTSITKGDPDVAAFGTPMAHMQGSCSIAEHFKAQQFIFDTTFCGDWAGGVYSTSGCPVSDSSSSFKSCVAYVAENPAAFAESYWEINYIKIYQTGVAASASASASRVESAATVVETVSSVKEVTNSVVATTAAATTVATTADAETATTMTLAETTTAAAATESSVADENGSSGSTSTHYVTMTTTICPIAESSSAAAALAGGSSEATEGSNSEGSSATATPDSVTGASAESNGSEGSSATETTPSTATGASAEANGNESSSTSEASSVASGTPSDISTTGASAEANGSEDSSASSEAKAVTSATPSSVTGASAEANGNDSASSNAATTSNLSGASTQAGDDESTPASAVANAGSSATPASVSGASAEANGSEQSAAAAASSVSGASAVANGSEGSSSQSSGSQAGSDSYGSVPSSAAAYGRPAPSSSSHAFSTAPSSSGSIRQPTSAAAANNDAAATQGSSASGSKSGHFGSGSSSATTPSTPVFTGGANKLTLGASSVVGVLAFALLA
ncbi:glycoside hydrolase family 16 protein [Aspergillus luchuensis CBS 106.47]|uniref:endo-1,3(4)-beta-glucanase n=2 Tax=Aspergillus subgen. Circumdati TaxID=2720871 RepID=A0A1M3TXQ3_ASPLC|nr:glycoside hydrolase family 16 protein [Aspergillus luchuensis CBS 106.47]